MNAKELKFLCMKEVEAKIGFKKSWIYERMAEGTFPQFIKIGGASRWLNTDIEIWMEQYIASQKRNLALPDYKGGH